MKKTIAFLLLSVLLLGLTACGLDEEAVKEELHGTWTKGGLSSTQTYVFYGDGVSYASASYDWGSGKAYVDSTASGTYTVEEDVIVISWKKGGEDTELAYTFKDGTLDLKGFTKD